MGLDTVELVMALEEEFGVEIDNAASEKIRTPGDVVDYLMYQLGCKGRRCVRQQRFYRLRAVLQKQLGLPRRAITLDLRLDAILPKWQRASIWRLIAKETENSRWPALQRPFWVKGGLWLMCSGIFLSPLQWRYSWADLFDRLTISFWLSVFAGVLGLWWTRWLCTVIPANADTIGNAIRVSTLPAPKVVYFEDQKAREAVVARVKKMVVEHLGIAESEFREDARFIEDYGAD